MSIYQNSEHLPDALKKTACGYIAAGLSTLPANKTKKIPTVSWKLYQHKFPTAQEWQQWSGYDGLCIITGAVSGNLLMLDFDQQAKAFDAWAALIPPELLTRCVIERSQRGGLHVIVRCDSPVGKNAKLALDANGAVLIETRGEGGLFLCSPTPGYELTQHDFKSIPVLTAGEVNTLIDAACRLNEKAVKKSAPQSQIHTPTLRTLHDRPNTVEKCRLYVEKLPPAISGEGGHDATYRVACEIFWGFGLGEREGWDILLAFNSRCVPEWSEAELRHKMEDALEPSNKTTTRGCKATDTASSVISGTDALEALWHSIQHGEPPKRWHSDPDPANPINRFAMRPGVVIAIGGSPGAGKTAFLCETIYKAMTLDKEVTALFVNVEMTPEQLSERLLASQSGVPLGDIIDRRIMPENIPRLYAGREKIGEVANRFSFLKAPYTIEAIKATVDLLDPKIVVIDYAQRIRIEKSHAGQSARDKINVIMEDARSIANEGRCVIAVSALSRGDGNEHKSGITAFRDSSEFEYGADDIWILDKISKKEKDADYVSTINRVLRCHKKRSGMPQNIKLTFDGQFQRFTVESTCTGWNPPPQIVSGNDTSAAEGGFIE